MVSKVDLQSFNKNEGFSLNRPKWVFVLWYLFKVAFFLTSLPYPNKFKLFILKVFGAKVGCNVIIKPRVNIHFPWKLAIGNGVWLGEEVFILNFEPITIGNNVCVSQRAFLCGGNHDYSKPAMPYRNAPINLLDGCWVGANVFVGPGVNIGTDTVVSAGSVVLTNLPENSIFKGNPAVFIKNRW